MKAKSKQQKKPTKYVVKLNSVIEHPPPMALKPCPRCGEEHKKIAPKKFGTPMEFFTEKKLTQRASHWVLCPKTKEPVILFDRYSRTVTQATFDVKNAFVLKAGESKEKTPQQINVKYEGKTWGWTYDDKAKAKKSPKAEKQP